MVPLPSPAPMRFKWRIPPESIAAPHPHPPQLPGFADVVVWAVKFCTLCYMIFTAPVIHQLFWHPNRLGKRVLNAPVLSNSSWQFCHRNEPDQSILHSNAFYSILPKSYTRKRGGSLPWCGMLQLFVRHLLFLINVSIIIFPMLFRVFSGVWRKNQPSSFSVFGG